MRRGSCIKLIIILSLITLSCSSANKAYQHKRDLSPYDFGLAKAKTGTERYDVLLRTHQAAVAAGVNVDYSGIDTIRLEIPAKPSRIPLTQYNDFKGCVLEVSNNSCKSFLFGYSAEEVPVMVSKSAIDEGDFHKVRSLKHGRYLLKITDDNYWVDNRRGYSYGHKREDILLVEDGVAKNTVIKPYNNVYSTPKCSLIKIGDSPITIKNLSVIRDLSCTYVTNVFYISGTDNINISDITIKTPDNSLSGDAAICILNSTNVTLDNVRIEGTYSQKDRYGYGISLGNVWNFKASRLYGRANWGIFGNNNVNVARIENSQINRFDIHCYGRDISFKNVSFFDLYNQYSSVYGSITHENCTFTNFIPIRNGGSYNSYVEHEVIFNNCVFNADPDNNCIFKLSHLNEPDNARHELAEKSLPNVKINNMVVNMTNGADNFFLFNCTSSGKSLKEIGNLSNITIDGLTINPSGGKPVKQMMLSNIEIGTKVPVDIQMKNVTVNNPQTKSSPGNSRPFVQLKSNLTVKGGKIQLRNATGIVQ